MLRFELHGEMNTQRDEARTSIVSAELTTPEHRTANAPSVPKTSAQVRLGLKPICVDIQANSASTPDFDTAASISHRVSLCWQRRSVQ